MNIVEIWKLYETSPMYCKDVTERRREAVRKVWNDFARTCWSRPVKSLTSNLIADYLRNECLDKSPKTYDEHLRIIRQVIRAVLSKTGLKVNPADEVPVRRKRSVSRNPFTRDQIEGVITAVGNGVIPLPCRYRTHGKTVEVMRPYAIPHAEEVKLSILLGAYCGMRLGDAVAVDKTMYDGLMIRYTPRKTETSSGMMVEVPVVDDRLKDALEGCEGLLTPNLMAWHGHNASTLSRLYKRIFGACGLETQVACENRRNASVGGFHALRHSFATWAANENVPIEIVQSVLGHTSVITTRIYAHVSAQRKAMELARIMGKGI